MKWSLGKISCLIVLIGSAVFSQSYSVKGPALPKPYEETAIKELVDYLARRINGELRIGGQTQVVFQVGDTELAKEHQLLSTELPDEEWHIKNVGNQVILNGGGTHGALYATYHFLEDFCGIHWWNDFEDYVPAASALTLETLDVSGKPVMSYRDIFRADGINSQKLSAATAIRNRLNRDGSNPIPANLGGSFNYGPPYENHTFDLYIPASKYLETHPEYFALVKGKRIGGRITAQLCLSNPEVRRIFSQRLKEFVKLGEENAQKQGVPAPRIYDISMNDARNPCECPKCMAEVEKYNYSGFYLNFVNELAAELKQTHPELYISTFAYYFTETPPRGGVRAADNVIVRLCDTNSNQAASILDPKNAIFHDFVAQWKHYAKNLVVWDYAITFMANSCGLPFASEFHYGDLFRYYHENSVMGVFWEHEELERADMWELKYFLECKLMENPYQDADKLIDVFMNCYYGPAAPYVKEYRKHLCDACKKNDGFIGWHPAVGAFGFFTNEDIVDCQALFDKAETLVADDKILFARVRHARCPLDRLTCRRRPATNYHGVEKANKVLVDAQGAADRQLFSWTEWTKNFVRLDGKNLAKSARDAIMDCFKDYKTGPVPEKFKDKSYYDYTAHAFEIHNSQKHYFESFELDEVRWVSDADSSVGVAVRLNVSDNMEHYTPPFKAGVYDEGWNKTLLDTNLPIQEGAGYHWYHVGRCKIPDSGQVFMTRAWTVKLMLGQDELRGNEFDIWLSAKHVGPMFHKEQDGENMIYLDRILLVY